METFKIGICEADNFSVDAMDMLRKYGQVSVFKGNNVADFISDKDAIFVRLKYLIDDDVISKASKLKYICSPTTGLNHIRISNDAVTIISLKGEYEYLKTVRATPEHIFGLTIALLRNYKNAFLNANNARFDRNPYRGYELYNNSVGIIGYGRIGHILSEYFHVFGTEVRYYDNRVVESSGSIKCDSVEQLINNSNIIILAVNYTKDNEKMISGEKLSLMKDKYFINAARGELVDEDALVSYIEKDHFKGVAVDVISDETRRSVFLEKLLKLTSYRNLIITPHIGGATFSSMKRTEEFIARKLIDDMAVRRATND